MKEFINTKGSVHQICGDTKSDNKENGLVGYDKTKILDRTGQSDESVQVLYVKKNEVRNILNDKQDSMDAWKEGKRITKY